MNHLAFLDKTSLFLLGAGISIGLGLIVFILKYLKPFLIWLKGGIENGDGVLENKDISIFVFIILCVFMIVTSGLFDAEYSEIEILMVFSGACGLSGIDAYRKKNKQE